MAIQLKKGADINLSKAAAALTVYKFGLSWDQNADLDAVALVIGDNEKIVNPDDQNIAYYGNCTNNKFGVKANPISGITHSGDATDGSAAGDDETITIDTTKLDAKVSNIIIAITSYSDSQPVPFAASVNPTAKLYDQNGNVLFEVKLDSNAAFSTCAVFVKLTKAAGEWIVTNITEAIGNSQPNGLADLMDKYGR